MSEGCGLVACVSISKEKIGRGCKWARELRTGYESVLSQDFVTLGSSITHWNRGNNTRWLWNSV